MSSFAEMWLVVTFCRREVRRLAKDIARRQRVRAWYRARGYYDFPELGGKGEA